MFEIRTGDCLDVLRGMADSSVDSIVTDPPYGLSFMGKKWDYDVPDVAVWAECLRVLKPGGHLLAFAGTRTQHRMAVRIEDAGFEIRDMIAWVYGSGFPKSLDVSKAIDKRGGNAHLTAEIGAALKAARKARGMGVTEADRTYCGGVTLWSWYEGRPAGQQMPTSEVMRKIARDWPELQRYADAIEEAEREVVGQKKTGDPVAWYAEAQRGSGIVDITTPATPAAQQWAGWGTALKPALEPITVARKPLVGTVAENVLQHGTGGINVDGCRIESGGATARPPLSTNEHEGWQRPWNADPEARAAFAARREQAHDKRDNLGRWPANLIHDGSEEPAGLLGSAARFFYCAKASKRDRDEGLEGFSAAGVSGVAMRGHDPDPYWVRVHNPDPQVIAEYLRSWRERRGITKGQADAAIGGATLYSWFEGRPAGIQLPTPEMWRKLKDVLQFDDLHDEEMMAVRLQEKRGFENNKEAHRNTHPTVKPTDLMRYLCRLVTPPGGLVLDPFAGSGSTGKGALLEGFRFLGIERDPDYARIAQARCAAVEPKLPL